MTKRNLVTTIIERID